MAWQTDCVYGGTLAAGNATGCELTTGWSSIAAYEHYWTPQWHQDLVNGDSGRQLRMGPVRPTICSVRRKALAPG